MKTFVGSWHCPAMLFFLELGPEMEIRKLLSLFLQAHHVKVISSRFDQTVSIVHLKGHAISAESQKWLSHSQSVHSILIHSGLMCSHVILSVLIVYSMTSGPPLRWWTVTAVNEIWPLNWLSFTCRSGFVNANASFSCAFMNAFIVHLNECICIFLFGTFEAFSKASCWIISI